MILTHPAEQRIFELTRDELDALPYGVITLDRRGTILRYNYTEAVFARRTTAGTIGLGFFTDVAPCTNVQAFKGRFDEFARDRHSGAEQFDFTFAFRWGSQDVSITLLRKAEHDEINLIVRGRTQAALDIAPPTEDAGPIAMQPASPVLAPGMRELECGISWDIGSAAEAAWRASIHPDDAAGVQRVVDNALALRRPYVIEYRRFDAQRKQQVVQEHGSFASGNHSIGRATIVDVTEPRQQAIDLWRAAHYDERTGLPNRALLLERIAAAVHEVRDNGRVAAVLSLVLTGFESLNATFGRATADQLLRLAALRLGESIRGGDTVARLDGAAFVVLLTDVEDVKSVTATSHRILEAFSEPFVIDERSHRVSASLGMSVTPRNGSDAAALLRAAESAMFLSQKNTHGDTVLFSSDVALEVANGLRTEDELRAALDREEFVVHYQPIVDIDTDRIVAVEALVRWNHPSRGLVMPGNFISVAERSGIIGPLGDWVLREACRQTRAWLDLGFALHVCVNVSTVRFRQPTFVDFVASVIAETGIAPETLELELTESVMVDGFNEVIETLGKLKLLGVRLAIDDFGTGYSSLSYLKYFPIDTLKIDRAFVADIATDKFDHAIAKAVLALASDLQVDCIAEGVETREQLELLRQLGCHRVQGYYFARPQMPAVLGERFAFHQSAGESRPLHVARS